MLMQNNTTKITSGLKNSYEILQKLSIDDMPINTIGMKKQKWYGCFGVQSYIKHSFLLHIEQKYRITNMITNILCRADRCCLERIMGCIFFTEYPKILKIKSILGNITTHINSFRYTFDRYNEHFKKKTIPRVVIKVWSGR